MLLETVCQARRLLLLDATVATWSDLRQAARAPWRQPLLAGGLARTSRPRAARDSSAPEPLTAAMAVPPARARRDLVAWRSSATDLPALGPFDRAMLDLVGRHAFLPTRILATVLDRDVRWAQRRRASLAARGLLRVVPVDELNPPELARHGLLELTQEGLVVLAAHLGLPLGAAVRHHGLAGGGSMTPVGPRAALLAHLSHTLGADAVFAAFARAARAPPCWRSVAGVA